MVLFPKQKQLMRITMDPLMASSHCASWFKDENFYRALLNCLPPSQPDFPQGFKRIGLAEFEGQMFTLPLLGALSSIECDPQCARNCGCRAMASRNIAKCAKAVQQNGNFLLRLLLFDKKSHWQYISAKCNPFD